jgi:hypothetical protein
VAALIRFHGPDDPQVIEARKDLADAKRRDRRNEHIQALLDQFPPLSAEEKSVLTRMLTGGDRDGTAA